MYDTATKAQFIDLRARGWSYDKIARHTGISKTTLLTWGREFAADIENLKADYISPRTAFPDGTAQETYFHNLPGESLPKVSVPARKPRRTTRSGRHSTLNKKLSTKLRRRFRKLLNSPVIRAALRYAIFKH